MKCRKTLKTAVSVSSYGDWLAMENMSESRKSPMTLWLEGLKMISKRLTQMGIWY